MKPSSRCALNAETMLPFDEEPFNGKPPLPKARRHSLQDGAGTVNCAAHTAPSPPSPTGPGVEREVMKVTAEKPFENTGESPIPGQRFPFMDQSEFEEASSESEDDDNVNEDDGDEFEEIWLSRNSLRASKFRFDGDSEDFMPKLLASNSSNSFEKFPTSTHNRHSKSNPAVQLPLNGPNLCTAPGQVPLPREAFTLTSSLEGLKAAAASGDILAQWRFRRRMEGNQMSLLPLSGFCSQQNPPPGLLQPPPLYPPRYANFPTVSPSHSPQQTNQQHPVPASYFCSADVRTFVPNSMQSFGCNNFSLVIPGPPNVPGPSLEAPTAVKKVILRETAAQYESNDIDQFSGRRPQTTSKSSETPKCPPKDQTDAAVQCVEQSWNAESTKQKPAPQDSSPPPNGLLGLINQVVRQHVSYDRSPTENNASNSLRANSPKRNHCYRPPTPSNHTDDTSTWSTPVSSPMSSITPLKSSGGSGRSSDFTNDAAKKDPIGEWLHNRMPTAVDASGNVTSTGTDSVFSEDVILQQLKAARDNCARKLRLVEEVIQRKKLGAT